MLISVDKKRGKCATILPSIIQEGERILFGDELVENPKEFMSGYTFATLDILTEETCMNDLKVREMKEDIKNVFCTVTNPVQKSEEKVWVILLIICQNTYLMKIVLI